MPNALFALIPKWNDPFTTCPMNCTECAENSVDTLHLHNFGEPLLDKKLPERIRLCKELGIKRVKMFSNGALLTEEELCAKLGDASFRRRAVILGR